MFDTTRGGNGLYACGHALFIEGKFAEAACVFRGMAAAIPTDERAWLGLGACHEAVEHYALAIDLYATAEGVATSARSALARARVLRITGEDNAEALERAIELAHGDEEIEALVAAERSL